MSNSCSNLFKNLIGQVLVDKNGNPIDGAGRNLAQSPYQPEDSVKELFARVMRDYQVAWSLQHRPLNEFDGYSLLQRTKIDQETFGAFVGAEFVPESKKWRWRGRKNTSRNKLIGILAHMLSGMLYPMVRATNEENDEDKMSARVMRIMVESHLREAQYELKFLYMVLSALVNPASIVEVKYVEAWQTIKEQLANGQVKIREAIDTFLSGLVLDIVPIDQFLIADLYTPDIQSQPYIIIVDRISWNKAKKIYGQHEDFKYVEPGKTKIVMSGQTNQILYDIEWTEADQGYVQVIRALYRDEDLETVWVGGVFMGNKNNIYNTNPFKHRRLSLIENEWVSVPIYHWAKTFFEPIDATGRFFYGKSGAFKTYWEDKTQNETHGYLVDGMKLAVFPPMFINGIANVDSEVIAPAAVSSMPIGANATQYLLSSNLPAAMQVLAKQEQDMSESTQDKLMSGQTQQGITATQSIQAQNQAKIILGPFGIMISRLIEDVGALTVDCEVQHTTVAEVDATVPGSLRLKEKRVVAKSKEHGKEVSNQIVFTDKLMGKKMTKKQINDYEWKLWEDAGGEDADKVIYHVNPYKFARMKYSMYVDADQIINAAYGNNKLQKLANFQILTDERIAPFTDRKAVADEVIEEFSVGDPDKFKLKAQVNDMMSAVMGHSPPMGEGSMSMQNGNKQLAQAFQ